LSAVICVENADQLQAALDTSASSDEDDIIKIEQGTYNGNFTYTSSRASNLAIMGGYIDGCVERVVDATSTVLDAQRNGPVLVFSTPTVAANFVVDGVTIQNGFSNSQGGGGIFCTVNGGNSILSNNIFTNNESIPFGGGAIFFQNNESVTLENNTISKNKSHAPGGGAFFYRINIVNLYDNNILENQAGGTASVPGNGGGLSIYNSNTVILEQNPLYRTKIISRLTY
jgi:hypothetical protein